MNVLAGILGVLTLFSLAALTGFFLWRWEERDIERRAMEWRREQARLATHRDCSPCARWGHRYQQAASSVSMAGCVEWFCPVCGERITVLDLDGAS